MDDELWAALELTSDDLARMEAEGEPADIARTPPAPASERTESAYGAVAVTRDRFSLRLENLSIDQHSVTVGDQSALIVRS